MKRVISDAKTRAVLAKMEAGEFVVANSRNVEIAFDQFIGKFTTIVFPGGNTFTRYGDSRDIDDIVGGLIHDFKRKLNWDISKFPPAHLMLKNLFWQGVKNDWYEWENATTEDFEEAADANFDED